MKNSKINRTIILALTAVICFSGCRSPDSEDKLGTIQLAISNPVGRNLTPADSGPAVTNTNVYEVFIYNGSQMITTQIDISSGPVCLSVEEGVYTVLVLAGYKSGASAVLLGSGSAASVNVISENVTEVSISLSSVSHQFNVPSSVICSSEYQITLSADTNNPLLQITANGTTMDNRPYIEIGDDSTNVYLECITTGPQLTGSINLSAPAQPVQTVITLFGSNIKIYDSEYSIDSDAGDIGSINWTWMNNTLISGDLKTETEKNIEFTAASTGINITIDWN